MMPAQRSTFAATVVCTALGNAAIALAIAAPAHAQPTDRPQLPEWVQLAGEVRDRIEGFTGSGFTPGRDDAYNLTRLKLDVTSRPARLVTFKIQLQDARPFGKDVGPTAAPFKDVLNLHLAYVDIGDPPVGTFGLRIGRQELSFGDERLIGTAGWLNAPRAFDAARATIRRPGVQIDAFGASVVRVADAVFADSSALW